MQYSLSSKYASNKSLRIIVDIVTWIFRILIGGTFIFSGFVKAVDPWGSIYKFGEYFAAFGLPLINPVLITGVFALCSVEFLIGVSVITGSYRKASPICSLCFMAVMLPLTLWIALSNPVADCGCFGDFLIISNWATFWKNVALTAMIIWLIIFNKNIPALITPALQWIQLVCSFAYIIVICLYGYFDQPLLDFRPYSIGETLIDTSSDTEDERISFIYEKDGIEKEFNIDDELPSEEDGWTFKERKELHKKSDSESTGKSLRIWDRSGNEDVTDLIISNEGDLLLILMPELDQVSPATTWKINSLYDASANSGIDMIAIVAGSSEMIDEWEDLSMPEYEIYTADDTSIKEIARGNPALVFVSNGKIKWKTSLGAVDVDEITKNGKLSVNNFANYGEKTALNLTYIYIASLAVLIVLSFFPMLGKVFFTHGDKVHREV